jgi:hypothetical protein
MDLDLRTLSLCSRCLEGCPEADLVTLEGRRLCPECLETERAARSQGAAEETASEASGSRSWLRALFSSVVLRRR